MDKARERVRWACRRGMLECDLFFVPFFEHCYDTLSEEEKQIFQSLLVESDADLILWLMNQQKSPYPQYELMIEKIRSFKRSHCQI